MLPKNKPKFKFDLHYLPVGKFGLKIRKSPASKDLRMRKTTQESYILVGHQQFLKYATQKFFGENRREVNSFNKIPVLSTPKKGKSEHCEVSVVNLALIFDSTSANHPGQHKSQSPAKRRKWGQSRGKRNYLRQGLCYILPVQHHSIYCSMYHSLSRKLNVK